MSSERVAGGSCSEPFPIYEKLVEHLLAAHTRETDDRDRTVAHVLGTCAGYSYSDTQTVATMMSRLGLEANGCVRIAQTVDAMFIFSTVYLVQSRCGRVVILCYRGTEPSNLANWLGDADVGSDSMKYGREVLRVHSGFFRNVRATRFDVLQELKAALAGKSLLEPDRSVPHPMQALYVTGHSLGGAMAVLFALSVDGNEEHRAIAGRLRAVYTYGQPMTVGDPLPEVAQQVARKVFRHVIARDLIPALPAKPWGHFAHFGHEFRFENGDWQRAETPVAQLENLREIPRSLLAFFATAKRREASRYTMAEHGPHHYLSALRPKGTVTEFGDHE
ncbi:MAG: lipase family protein [Thermoanaerobaculia bacterium]